MLQNKMKNVTLAIATISLSACSARTDSNSRMGDEVSKLLTPTIETPRNTSRSTSLVEGEQSMTVFLTGYSYWDNTPRGSARIARPVIHQSAGGTGTYDDPITLAVGHVKRGSTSTMDYPAGTRFYVQELSKYAIVEDLCGDGNNPQNGPCHSGYQGYEWLDIYVGGRSVGEDLSDACMYRITGVQTVILNPQRGYPVLPGEISTSTCANT